MEVISLNTCIVGSGAAGFNAAVRLRQFGVDRVAVVTEGVNMGTSRNTGSDKQTYYKLGLAGDARDSVAAMAADAITSIAIRTTMKQKIFFCMVFVFLSKQ